jgi:aminopeptidase N
VRVLYPPAFDRTLAGEALRLAERAMGRYAAWFGPYPYPEVDVVLAPFGRFSGMEYPTLVLSVPAAVPIAHELAHQWWYGIVGDDEYRAPWLDESFATWSERALDGTAGAGCASLGWPAAPAARVTATMAYWRTRPRDYGTVVYGQGACALQALSARLGRRRFLTLLRAYVARHRFGISTTASFEAAAQTASPDASLAGLWHRYRIG